MKLETRVEQLEHEVKILKNEIQHTLLEIQEQILIHYYPALRAAESEDSQQMATVLDALRTRQNGQSGTDQPDGFTGRIGTDIRWQDQTYDGVQDKAQEDKAQQYKTQEMVELPGARAREISLADIRRKRTHHTGTELPGAEHANGIEPRPARPAKFGRMADWVAETVRKVGKERARNAVETYAGGGYMPPETKEMVLQLIALADDETLWEPGSSTDTIEVLVQLDNVLNDRS